MQKTLINFANESTWHISEDGFTGLCRDSVPVGPAMKEIFDKASYDKITSKFGEWCICWGCLEAELEPGDIIERHGVELKVLEVDREWGTVKGVCKTPQCDWLEVGEDDEGIINRFRLVRKKGWGNSTT